MGKKILLADDSITIQKVIELTFSDEDFEVVTVGNGRLAIEKVQDVRPDVVLCDIIMPEKDGYEVCDFVKKNPALSHIPVLLLTGAFEPFDQERAARVGCDGFLAKPFEPQALIAKVKDLLRQVEARHPAAASVPAAAPAAPPASAAAEPEPSPAATVWAAPSPVSTPAWEPPQTRPVWTAHPPAPPAPPAEPEPSGVQFIPEDPFGDESSVGFAPSSGETVRVPSFPEETFDSAPEVEPEPYVLEGSGREDDLMPMTPDEEESFAEPMTWDAAPSAAAPEPPRGSANTDRDLFLEEVFDEATAAVEAAHAAAPSPAAEPPAPPAITPEPVGQPEPEPHPVRAESLPDFAAVAHEAGFTRVPAPEPEPEPLIEEPAFEPEREPEPPTAMRVAPAPLAAAPAPEPPPVHERAHEWAPPPPERLVEPPIALPPPPEPTPSADIQLEEESFADVPAEPAAPAAAAAPSEAGAVAVPMDMVSQIAQRVVAQISEKVIREIAWEVIPDMAEALIKREIERLTAELHQG